MNLAKPIEAKTGPIVCNMDEADIPALLDLVTDEAFDQADSNSDEVWAPLHAWRTLGHGQQHSHNTVDCTVQQTPG